MEKTDTWKHLKAITPGSMTVFIDTPMYMEGSLKYVPFFANDCGGFAYPSDDGLKLSARGYYTVKEAVESMTRVAEFYTSHREELIQFYAEYNRENRRLSDELAAAKTRTRTETDWRKHASLIREQFEIDKKHQGLFREMYQMRFGEKVPVIDEEYCRELDIISKRTKEAT